MFPEFLSRLRRWPLALAAVAFAPAALAAPPHTVPDTMAQRMLVCTACHGAEGRATPDGYFPRIAGKPAGYLYNQLLHFKAGRRQAVGMTALLDPLTDAYLLEMAQHFASLDLPYPPPARRGEQLVKVGDASRQIPSCNSCHGDRMTGVQPAIPGLLGLPRDYLISQLGGWQTGLRRATAPDCMGAVAKRLSGPDVTAVAAWLAAQPVPANAKPIDRLPAPLPIDCGHDLQGPVVVKGAAR
jgi:cytochrome c553